MHASGEEWQRIHLSPGLVWHWLGRTVEYRRHDGVFSSPELFFDERSHLLRRYQRRQGFEREPRHVLQQSRWRTRLRARMPRASPMTEARTTCAAARNLASSSLRCAVCGDGTIAFAVRDSGVRCGDTDRVFGLPSRPPAVPGVARSGESLVPAGDGDSSRTVRRSLRRDPARVICRLPLVGVSLFDDTATLRLGCGDGVLRGIASLKGNAIPPLALRRAPAEPRDRAGDGCASRSGDTDCRSGDGEAILPPLTETREALPTAGTGYAQWRWLCSNACADNDQAPSNV